VLRWPDPKRAKEACGTGYIKPPNHASYFNAVLNPSNQRNRFYIDCPTVCNIVAFKQAILTFKNCRRTLVWTLSIIERDYVTNFFVETVPLNAKMLTKASALSILVIFNG
jgi:hypothetical protein